jgi:GT2 family glycosyltransferase
MALNPDVILASGFVKAMVDALSSSPTAGFANGRLYTRRDVTVPGQEGKRIIDVTWLSIEKRRRQFCPYQFKEDCAELDRPRNVFGADGAAPMFKREMLEDVRIGEDYYDPAFFSGKEDLDISWRARLFGWDCLYVPTAVAYHRRTFTPVDKRRSVPKAFRIASIRNRYLVMIRNDLLQLWLRDLPRILWYDFLILSHVILREPESLRAYFDVVRLLPLQLRKRREIMQRRRASVEEMAQWFV